MANVSYLRIPPSPRAGGKLGRRSDLSPRRSPRVRYVAGGLLLLAVAVVAAGALILVSARASLTADPSAIAKVGLPLGGGTIERATLVSGPHSAQIPVQIRGDQIWPAKLVPAGEKISLYVVVKRPGWVAWLAGSTQQLHLSLTTPVASLRSHYLTVSARAPLRLHFKQPIQTFSYGSTAGRLRRQVFAAPRSVVKVARSTVAGTLFVAAAPRGWESSQAAMISWFPVGSAATAVANPAPGTPLKSDTPITLTFSKPVSQALGSDLPPVSPITPGTWHKLNSHTIVFRPEGYGYGLGAKVNVGLPSAVRLLGGTGAGGSWRVPAGSNVRLQQVLATLGYLPLRFGYAAGATVPLTPQAQEAAAVKPPRGRFSWRYPDTPSWLMGDWQPGTYGEVTKAAVMAFENHAGMTADGIDGAQVWRAMINALIHDQRSSFGYTVADVSEGSPESLAVWHSGRTVLTTAVNTGIPQAPTAQGTFAVYEHLTSTTMSGTNPDGTPYSDPGIPFVSYFNGGDALHGFIRASYGTPQSLGCVEMPYATAAQVFPYTPIGTVVHVS